MEVILGAGEPPTQVVMALMTQRDTPAVTGEPGVPMSGNTDERAARCLLETANAKGLIGRISTGMQVLPAPFDLLLNARDLRQTGGTA